MKAQVESRGTGLLFFNLGATWGCVGNATSQLFTAGKRPSTPCTCGLFGPRTSLGGGKKISPRDLIPGPYSPFFQGSTVSGGPRPPQYLRLRDRT